MRMNKKGFTLVELMIVLAILGLLAGIGIPQYLRVLNRAKIGADLARIAQVQTVVNAFIAEVGDWDDVTIAAEGNVKISDDNNKVVSGVVTGKSLVTGDESLDLSSFFEEDFEFPKLESDEFTGENVDGWYIDVDTGNVFVGKGGAPASY